MCANTKDPLRLVVLLHMNEELNSFTHIHPRACHTCGQRLATSIKIKLNGHIKELLPPYHKWKYCSRLVAQKPTNLLCFPYKQQQHPAPALAPMGRLSRKGNAYWAETEPKTGKMYLRFSSPAHVKSLFVLDLRDASAKMLNVHSSRIEMMCELWPKYFIAFRYVPMPKGY